MLDTSDVENMQRFCCHTYTKRTIPAINRVIFNLFMQIQGDEVCKCGLMHCSLCISLPVNICLQLFFNAFFFFVNSKLRERSLKTNHLTIIRSKHHQGVVGTAKLNCSKRIEFPKLLR